MTKVAEGGGAPLARLARALANEPRFLMLLPGLFWAGNAIVARSVAGEIPPVALAFWRWAVGAALILPFAWPHLKRDCPIMLGHWPLMLALSALGIAVFNTCLYIAAHTTTAVNIVMLQSSMPVFIVAASFMLFRETVTLRQGVGFALSLLGALTLISHGDPGVFARMDFKPGDLWMLAAVVSYALYTAMLRLRPDVHGLSFIFTTFLIGAVLLIPIYAWETWSGHPLPLTGTSVLAIGYVAIFASILAYLGFNRVVELVGANTAGLIAHLVPVFGTILAVLLLDETLHTYNGAGIALIGLGVWLATLRHAA